MGIPYAELIGDPVAHSRSPLIHDFWLGKLGIEGEYRLYRCRRGEVGRHIRERCADAFWRGCNVTAPLKEEAARTAIDPTGLCARVGAANALFRSPLGCAIGANTDLHGIAAALSEFDPSGRIAVIGAGGAARALLEYLRVRQAAGVTVIARNSAKGRAVLRAFGLDGRVHGFADAGAALAGVDGVVNATPLGMHGREPMPRGLVDALERTAAHAFVFDMVYVPAETALLRRARELGRRTVDGMTMLIAQAAPAFETFFGRPAPREHDAELLAKLAS